MASSATELATLAGRTLLVGLAGDALGSEEAGRLRRLDPAGVILFARNLSTPERLAALVADLGALWDRPWLLALDQEGGTVSRLRPWIGETPDAAALAVMGEETTERFARATGRALRALGFNVDFAPVVDLCAPGAPNCIGARSFGLDPEVVVRLAERFLRGLEAERVAGCLKHFPGLGDTPVDSHVELPTCPRSRVELEAADLVPYRRLCAVAPSVMVGHGHYPAWTPGAPAPATGSQRIATGVLREELGFRGLVVTDDLEMGAVCNLDVDGSFAVQTMHAGCDLLLYCHRLERAEAARAALAAHAGEDIAFAHRLTAASDAVSRFAARYPRPTPEPTTWPAALGTFSEPGFRGHLP